jgi:hypothetical protein
MVSPEHVNEQKPADKPALSPAEEKQVPAVGEKKRPWMEPLLRAVAIVVSLIGGIAFYCLAVFSSLPRIENPPSERLAFLGGVAMLLVLLVGVGCAVLFRSWWATLVVPLSLILGAYLASYQLPQLIPITDPYYHEVVYGEFVFVLYFILPIAVTSAFIGSYLGTRWEKSEQITPPSPRWWETLLLQVLGIVMPVVGGFASSILALASLGISLYLDVWLTPILVVVPLTFVCARLVGHWWAILVVPLAFVIGQILMPFLYSGAGPDLLLAWPSYVIGGIVPATGALLGILTSKSFAPASQPMLGMALLLSMGLYGVALGEAFLLALLLWPNALQDNAFLGVGFLAMSYLNLASLLVLGSLISANVHWLLALGVFLLSLLAAFGLGWLFPSQQAIVFSLTYGVVVIVLSLILLARVKGVWSALWRPLLVAGTGAAIAIAVLVARGPDAWRYPPNGLDVLLVSLGVGVLILIGGYWFARSGRKPVLQG